MLKQVLFAETLHLILCQAARLGKGGTELVRESERERSQKIFLVLLERGEVR